MKLVDDVLLDFVGSGRSEGDRRRIAEYGAEFSDFSVCRTKIVSPLADTVGFIDGNKAYVNARDERLKRRRLQAFRRNKQNFDGTGVDGFQDGLLFSEGESRMERGGLYAFEAEGIDLVFHQSDERADDERKPWCDDSGELVTEAFSAACGHDGKRVMATRDIADDLFLTGPETR